MTDKQHVVELLDRLAPSQLAAVAKLLEVIIHNDDDGPTEDFQAIAASSRTCPRRSGIEQQTALQILALPRQANVVCVF
jgi:hypothetical protein